MSFGKMNGFADIVEPAKSRTARASPIPRMKSSLPSVCTGKVGMAVSGGQTSLHSVKPPTCSAFDVFLG